MVHVGIGVREEARRVHVASSGLVALELRHDTLMLVKTETLYCVPAGCVCRSEAEQPLVALATVLATVHRWRDSAGLRRNELNKLTLLTFECHTATYTIPTWYCGIVQHCKHVRFGHFLYIWSYDGANSRTME